MAWIFLSSLLPGMLGRNFNHSENRKIFYHKAIFQLWPSHSPISPLYKACKCDQWSLARNSQKDSGISHTAGGGRLGRLGAQVLGVQVQVQRGSSFYSFHLYCMQSAHQWIKILDDKRPNWYKGQSINLSRFTVRINFLMTLMTPGINSWRPHRHDDV